MSLTLKILSFNDQPYTGAKDVIIDEQGGTIGRADTNTLVLDDVNKIISRRHALVKFENGQYNLIDSSLGGTFIDNAIEPINNASVQLVDGMQIKIGEYIIGCSITDEASPFLSSIPENPFSEDLSNQPVEENELLDVLEGDVNSPFINDAREQDYSADLLASVEKHSDAGLLSDSENNDLLNHLEPDFNDTPDLEQNSLLDAAVTPESQSSQSSLSEENFSSLNDSFEPAKPIENNPILDNSEIPEDFNFEDLFKIEGDESESPASAPAPEKKIDVNEPIAEAGQSAELIQDIPQPVTDQVPTPAQVVPEQVSGADITSADVTDQVPSIDNNLLIKAFLRGVQMAPEDIDFINPVEKMIRIGKMFRQFVESTVSVLRTRAEFKSLFRVNVTTIQKLDNNPLKFAITTDEAIKHLINEGQIGFKGSVESIDEGFNDLLNHQLAMQAGIQASLNDILRQFDPTMIEKQYEEGIVLQKKSKCWDKYIEIHRRLSETAVEEFFGDAFSEAYDKQMKQLKN